jgi:hypothetical protein
VAYRRAVLERVGGFDPSFRRACEDTDLAMRARAIGARTSYEPDAIVHHDVHSSDYRAFLREKPRWEGVALVVSRHPELRSTLHSRWFWRASHPYLVAAVGGLALLVSSRLPSAGRRRRITPPVAAKAITGLALTTPYIHFRIRRAPLPGIGWRRRWLLLPATLVADATEVGVLILASVRYRTVVL